MKFCSCIGAPCACCRSDWSIDDVFLPDPEAVWTTVAVWNASCVWRSDDVESSSLPPVFCWTL
ncbi:MAG: hypothetical protein E6G32_11995 [Actinobacteria bacterium]|nr:MAG: hypothetical protein E6G32_11995 [Actinomycetota bacterium]